ncbi:MAG: glycosyltransferase family 87 protein [Anaerolineae bacterium]
MAVKSMFHTPIVLRRMGYNLLYVLLLFLLLHFVVFSVESAQRTSHSYVVLYTSARLVREGVDFSLLYNDRWFGQQTSRYDNVYRDIYRPHNPVTALMLLPLSDLDYGKSRVVWIMFNVVLLAAGSVRLLRELRLRGVGLALAVMAILLYDPLHVNLELGQSYILMFVLLVLAWTGYRRGDQRALGIALGLMFILKTAGVFLWVLLPLQRRWSALAWGVATVVLCALLSLPIVGVDAWLTYFKEVSYFNGQPFLTVTAYQTPTSLFGHLLTYDAIWNPTPVRDIPLLANVLTWVSQLVLIGGSVMISLAPIPQPLSPPLRLPHGERGVRRWWFSHIEPRHREKDIQRQWHDLTFAMFAIVSVLIVPLALDYHYMLLLLPLLIVATQRGTGRRTGLLLGLVGLLLATAIAYRQPALAVGWWALLAYPKLYGGMLLWGLALWQMRRMLRGGSGEHQGYEQGV